MTNGEPAYCEVVWKDAYGDSVDEATLENVHVQHKPLTMRTRGWVLLSNEAGVSMFTEQCIDTGGYRGRSFIPRGMIVSITELTFVKPRKKRIVLAPQVQEPPAT